MTVIAAQPETATVGDRLLAIMDDLDAAFAEIDAITGQQKQALRSLDREQLGTLAQQQQTVTNRVRSLQMKQRSIARQILPREQQHHATVTDIAMKLPNEMKHRVLQRAAALRSHAARVQRENASVGMATRSLVRHMESLTQQVQTRFSAGGTYSRASVPKVNVNRPNCLDLQS